jgi:pantothenate kinase type III
VDAHQFKGGSILPGVAMMIKALGNSTGMIDIDTATLSQHVEGLRDLDLVAVNSDAAVRAGALASVAGGVERCLRQMQQVCGGSVDALITGGDAKLVTSMIDYPCEIIPRLVLAGLALIAMGELE